MDPRYDQCTDCGGEDFVLHYNEWERTCEHCGLVSCIEFSLYDAPIEKKYYQKRTYFRNTILAKAIEAGAPINNEEIETMVGMFERSVGLFEENKRHMQRHNYPSLQFVLYKLGQILHKDLRPWCKLPKLKSTLAKVEEDWKYLDPSYY